MTELPIPERTRHRLSERYHALLREAGELHDAKQADYGEDDDPFANVRASADFGVPGWIGAILRGNDKMKRLQKAARQRLSGKKVRLQNESMENSLLDLAVYSLIALVLYEEEQGLLDAKPDPYIWDVDDMPIPMSHCTVLLDVINTMRRTPSSVIDLIRVSPDVVKPSHRERFFASIAQEPPLTIWGVPLTFDARLTADKIELRHMADGWVGRAMYVTEFAFSDFLEEPR